MKIRPMTLDDVSFVYEIEKRTHITPWSESILHDCVVVGYSCFVLVDNNFLCGFLVARQIKKQCHLLNLCIAPEHQSKGFGKTLLIYLMEGIKDSCDVIQLEVRASNNIAKKLYEKYGFEETGLKKNYYADKDGTSEDALLLSYQW